MNVHFIHISNWKGVPNPYRPLFQMKLFCNFKQKCTSEHTCNGFLPQPCFFRGRGFKDMTCFAWYELEVDFRWEAGVIPELCFAGGGAKLAFTGPPSCTSASAILEKGSIFWWRTWGMGLKAAILILRLWVMLGKPTPFDNISSLSLLSSFLMKVRLPAAKPFTALVLISWQIEDLFRLGGGGLNQDGGLLIFRLLEKPFFPCLEQKNRSRSASSLSNEATANPWMLAIPRATKLRYETSGASCLKTWNQNQAIRKLNFLFWINHTLLRLVVKICHKRISPSLMNLISNCWYIVIKSGKEINNYKCDRQTKCVL